jgi:hypothetical protein
MARLIAAALAAWLLSGASAFAQQGTRESELLLPLSVDLRRIYPDLVKRWDEAEQRRFARTEHGFVAAQGFLARPKTPRASMPSSAAGVVSVRAGSVRLRERLLGAGAAPGVAENGLLRYRGAFKHTEALFVAGDRVGAPMFLMIDPGAPTRIASAVSVRGGRLAVTPNGGLAVNDAGGATTMRLDPPVVLDARGRKRGARWALHGGAKGEYIVDLSLDPSGLVYPLLVR